MSETWKMKLSEPVTIWTWNVSQTWSFVANFFFSKNLKLSNNCKKRGCRECVQMFKRSTSRWKRIWWSKFVFKTFKTEKNLNLIRLKLSERLKNRVGFWEVINLKNNKWIEINVESSEKSFDEGFKVIIPSWSWIKRTRIIKKIGLNSQNETH